MTTLQLGPFDFGRIVTAARKVEERLLKSVSILEGAGVPYAIVGGNAVGNWISRVNESLVRLTRDIDVLIRREDLPRAVLAFEEEGFVFRHVAGVDMFLETPETKAGDGIHLLFAGEKVDPNRDAVAPDVEQAEQGPRYRVISLDALVEMKLAAFRRKDQMHLIDLIQAGLVDETWVPRLSEPLASRLQELLSDPNG